MLFDRRCPGCGRQAPRVCRRCLDALAHQRPDPAEPPPWSPSWSPPWSSQWSPPWSPPWSSPWSPSWSQPDRAALGAAGLDRFVAAFAYGELAGRILLAAKNGGRQDVIGQLAVWLPAIGEPVDVVTWVPASRHRRRQRGYDQGRVLARHAGRRLGVGHRRLLARPRRDAQAGRSRSDRLAGPLLVATGRCPPRILLVDDVSTTGASLANAAAVLRRAGARYVAAGVLAAVEPRSSAAAVPPSRVGIAIPIEYGGSAATRTATARSLIMVAQTYDVGGQLDGRVG